MVYLSINTVFAQEIYLNNMPDSVSNIYSDIDMRVRLANKPNEDICSPEQCALNKAFDTQVQELGSHLAIAAYAMYPVLGARGSRFVFSVVDKKEPGMASNAAGKIVVFRGIQRLQLSEDALAFLIAREMGHVIGRHHDKNTSTKIIISVLASVLFPVISIFTASNVVAQASNVTSLVTGATSYVGSEVVLARVKPSQLKESDDIALQLLEAEGRDIRSVTSVLQQNKGDGNWSKDLQITAQYLDRMLVKVDAAMEIERVADKSLK